MTHNVSVVRKIDNSLAQGLLHQVVWPVNHRTAQHLNYRYSVSDIKMECEPAWARGVLVRTRTIILLLPTIMACFHGPILTMVNNPHSLSGNTHFEYSQDTVLWSFAAGLARESPAPGNVDRNHQLEIVISASDGQLFVLNGADEPLPWNPALGDVSISSPTIADLNSDGYPEVIHSCHNLTEQDQS